MEMEFLDGFEGGRAAGIIARNYFNSQFALQSSRAAMAAIQGVTALVNIGQAIAGGITAAQKEKKQVEENSRIEVSIRNLTMYPVTIPQAFYLARSEAINAIVMPKEETKFVMFGGVLKPGLEPPQLRFKAYRSEKPSGQDLYFGLLFWDATQDSKKIRTLGVQRGVYFSGNQTVWKNNPYFSTDPYKVSSFDSGSNYSTTVIKLTNNFYILGVGATDNMDARLSITFISDQGCS